jgi:hypothetical protein
VGLGANGGANGGVDILSDVELVSFTATPDHIGPFGASQLNWKVTGPPSGFHVTLNGSTVPRAGGEIVQPQTSTSYHLNAVAVGGVTKFLRTLTVQVSDSSCETNSLFNPQVTIAGFLNTQVESKPDLYFNGDTEVLFSPGAIRFKLHLGKSVPRFPDPAVEIDASLGLAVEQGHVVSGTQNINTEVSVPWYVWLLPGTGARIAKANLDASQSAQELITGIGELSDFLAAFPSPLVKQSVRVGGR